MHNMPCWKTFMAIILISSLYNAKYLFGVFLHDVSELLLVYLWPVLMFCMAEKKKQSLQAKKS